MHFSMMLELQRRGGKPAETFSSGTSALARPDLCQEVHEAYLDAGADIILTHSYSSNRNVMTPSGNGERACECILSCAAIARYHRCTLCQILVHSIRTMLYLAGARQWFMWLSMLQSSLTQPLQATQLLHRLSKHLQCRQPDLPLLEHLMKSL